MVCLGKFERPENRMLPFDPRRIQTPAYVIDLGRLRQNLAKLAQVQKDADCSILLALKGYAAFSTFEWVRSTLSGASASSVAEARLAREYVDKEVHVYAPAYSASDIRELATVADHVVFNSVSQLERYSESLVQAQRKIEIGLRINPEHRETEVALYDPCAPGSRLGVPRRAMFGQALEKLDGLHFHNLCEKDSDALERTLAAVESSFGEFIARVKWVNFGGGHLITRPTYDVARLVRVVREFRQRWGKRVYLEPGEAIGLNTGWLIASVLDVFDYGQPMAILDASATAHMPDVLEMPYRPGIIGASEPGKRPFTTRLGGLTCLAGDVIGEYSFDQPLQIGDQLVFEDMAHYTMVKTTMFNGVRLPSIVLFEPDTDELRVVRQFGYEDYKSRLS
jgi:carboxynorspermidine decarboxylase